MRRVQTDVLVIGGGATGTGILRDLAMRGIKSILVEKRDLAYGTTGKYHGLLHSGGRYVVKDPIAASECIEENRILRQIMPQCIEDTGGFFVRTSHDDPSYAPRFVEGCKKAGIPVEEISIRQMLKEEPLLDPRIIQCFRVPDGSADSFLGCELNVRSALDYGALVFTYHELRRLTTVQTENGTLVSGAICLDLVKDEQVQIDASLVINASGAWAGKIAAMAGIELPMSPGKGTMIALNHRIVNTVINRCKLPSDGDILVPAHTVAVMGTTDIRVADPDSYSIEPWEIRLMLDEGEKIIPRFKELRILRAWAGVRPLVREAAISENRDITRGYTLIDHTVRDQVEGFITITGGKWTTYRKMAEVTVNKACEILGVDRACRTYLEPLPSKTERNTTKSYPGARLEQIEKDYAYGQMVCECELATRDEVVKAIVQSNAVTLDDIRRDVRLGMGPCQGAFCAYRAAGLLHEFRHPPVKHTNNSLSDFLQERWKGNMPILWGQQLRQERLNELIYISNLNINSMPIETESKLYPELYLPPSDTLIDAPIPITPHSEYAPGFTQTSDTVVIGAGLSGLIAGWRSCHHGLRTRVIAKGWGTLFWSSGCIDILSNNPSELTQNVVSPAQLIEEFIKSHPNHPYSQVGVDFIHHSIEAFLELSRESGYPYYGSLENNYLLPTALGTLRPTCLAPRMMISGDGKQKSPMLIVGFAQFLDFFPSLVADNLSEQGIPANALSLDLESLRRLKFLSGPILARLFDNPDFLQEVIDGIKPRLSKVGRIGFPAVLSLHHSIEVQNALENSLGLPVFEIPGLPPSIPGMRLHNMLVSAIERLGGTVDNGITVTSATLEGNRVKSVNSAGAVRQISHSAENYILATGGILGGGISTFENGYAQETIFRLPVITPGIRTAWFTDRFIDGTYHPIHSSGLMVDTDLNPVNQHRQVIFENLIAVGSVLGNCDPIREKSTGGVALSTGYRAGEKLSHVGSL